MTILYAGLILGALGLIFGGALSFASKKFYVETDDRIDLVKECTGGANCGACGFAGCEAFAKAVVEGKAKVNGCAPAACEMLRAMDLRNAFFSLFFRENSLAEFKIRGILLKKKNTRQEACRRTDDQNGTGQRYRHRTRRSYETGGRERRPRSI